MNQNQPNLLLLNAYNKTGNFVEMKSSPAVNNSRGFSSAVAIDVNMDTWPDLSRATNSSLTRPETS